MQCLVEFTLIFVKFGKILRIDVLKFLLLFFKFLRNIMFLIVIMNNHRAAASTRIWPVDQALVIQRAALSLALAFAQAIALALALGALQPRAIAALALAQPIALPLALGALQPRAIALPLALPLAFHTL